MTRQLLTLVTTSLLGIALAAPVPKPSADWVTMKGCVVWPEKKPIPKRQLLPIGPQSADARYAVSGGHLYDDSLLVHAMNRGVRNVVVWLRPDSDDARAAFTAEQIHPDLVKPVAKTHKLEMEFCRYSARVLALRAGDKLEVVNKGVVAENFNFQGTSVEQNVLLPPQSKPMMTEPILTENSWVSYKCDIHPWMQGRVRVFDHPYFAVTDENGDFEIKLAPKGKWRVVYWHESGYHQGREGRLGFPLNIQDQGKGAMRLKTLELDLPSR